MYSIHAKIAKPFAMRFALLFALLFLLLSGRNAQAAPPQTIIPVLIRGVNYGNIVTAILDNGSITVVFVPAAGYTVQSVADAIGAIYGIPPGQATMNWLQICTASSGVLESDINGNVQHPPFVDPPAGGTAPQNGTLGSWADDNPFYYNAHAPLPGSYDPSKQDVALFGMISDRIDDMGNLSFNDAPTNTPNSTVSFDTFLSVNLGNGNFVNLAGFSWSQTSDAKNVVDPNKVVVTPNIPYSSKDQTALAKFGKKGLHRWLPTLLTGKQLLDWLSGTLDM